MALDKFNTDGWDMEAALREAGAVCVRLGSDHLNLYIHGGKDIGHYEIPDSVVDISHGNCIIASTR